MRKIINYLYARRYIFVFYIIVALLVKLYIIRVIGT
jgi:hypothetical protein